MPRNSPNFMIMNTTINANAKVLKTIIVLGIISANGKPNREKSVPTTEKPRIIANAAPNDAPEATPSVSGETRGFPKLPCISAPAIANAAPANIAINTLGSRYFSKITDCVPVGSSIPRIILPIFTKLRDSDEPKPMAKTAKNRVNKISRIRYFVCFFDRWSIRPSRSSFGASQSAQRLNLGHRCYGKR